MNGVKRKQRLFYLLALSIPLVLLLLMELGLRLLNYGQHYPLFIPSPINPAYLQTNPEIIKRYFPARQAPAISPDTVLFKATKPEDSFRIVIQGESSAAGFPYGRWGSLQGMLEQRFKREYPDRRIEIINTAMAGVTSYTLLDLADDILAVQPDLVIIYAGHNEYLGVLGVGSALTSAGQGTLTRLQLKLKRLRLYQLLEQLLIPPQSEVSSSEQQTLMARVAAGQHIELDSAMYRRGLAQYRRNMSRLLKRYQRQQIPVLLGNLVSNERDLPPFSAVPLLDWPKVKQQLSQQRPDAQQQTAWRQQLQQEQAGHYYLTALLAEQQGELAQARQAYQRARDADTLRFRAPNAFNQVVAELAEQHSATIVDVEQAFRQHSVAQIIGNNLLLEHVHPNVDGYFLLAEQFYQAIVQSGLLGAPLKQLSTHEARQDVLLSKVDIGYADLKVAHLTGQYPFASTRAVLPELPSNEAIATLILQRAQGEDWLRVQEKLLHHYRQQHDWLNGARVAASMADALPDHQPLLSLTANLYFQAQQLDLASYYFKRALQLAPPQVSDQLNLAHLYFLQGKLHDSLTLLLDVQSQQPKHPQLDHFILRVRLAMADSE